MVKCKLNVGKQSVVIACQKRNTFCDQLNNFECNNHQIGVIFENNHYLLVGQQNCNKKKAVLVIKGRRGGHEN